ncbi:MAG TPA: hypothetical protein ENM97_07900 [Moorella mulderi]|nr:hypothetical protein [Moorella mulderi]
MKILQDIISSLKGDAPVKEVRIGPFWTGVWSRYCGLSSTLLPPGHHGESYPVREAGFLTEKSARELCPYVFSPSPLEASVGMAAINSLLEIDEGELQEINAEDIIAEHGRNRNVVIVGHFPFVERIRNIAQNLWVLEKNPQAGDLPAEAAEEVIPQADVVAITGTALINGTLEGLLQLCSQKSLVMVLGPTTPLSPVLFDHGVHVVSGTRVTDPEWVLKAISQGVVFKQLKGRGVRLLTMSRI